MSCKIYFIRHGQSIGNLKETFLGHTDLDLSELGYTQARFTANFLQNKNINVIYSSDLMRAYNTACAFSETCAIDIIKEKLLREINAGEWENNTYSYLKEKYFDTYNTWLKDIGNAHPNGGESVRSLQKRIIDIVTKIAKENDEKNIAVFTHATPIRTFFSYISDYSIDEIKDFPWPSNCSVSIAEYNNGLFSKIDYNLDYFLEHMKTTCSKNV